MSNRFVRYDIDNKQVLSMLKEGKRICEVARKFGCSWQTIWQIKCGYRKRKHYRYDNLVRCLLRKRKSRAEIARAIGCDRRSVWRIIERIRKVNRSQIGGKDGDKNK